jgi:hypothetical protein
MVAVLIRDYMADGGLVDVVEMAVKEGHHSLGGHEIL